VATLLYSSVYSCMASLGNDENAAASSLNLCWRVHNLNTFRIGK